MISPAGFPGTLDSRGGVGAMGELVNTNQVEEMGCLYYGPVIGSWIWIS